MFKDHVVVYLWFFYYAIAEIAVAVVYGPQTWEDIGISCFSFLSALIIIDLYADWKSSDDRP
jgi:hypothetical protein